MPNDAQFPLLLTSPLTKGPLVREAQRLLRHNDYGDFRPGPTDGEFGPKTAAAVRRAKTALGYEPGNVNEVYGRWLHAFLLGTAELPKDQKNRRAQALEQAKRRPIGLRALDVLAGWVGTAEQPPGSNNIMFSRWYMRSLNGWPNGGGPPWCMMAVSYAFVHVGSSAFSQGSRYAYCPFFLRDAQAGLYGLEVIDEFEPGCVVLYELGNSGPGEPDHVGIGSERVNATTVKVCEGNSDNMVRWEERREGLVAAYVRVTK